MMKKIRTILLLPITFLLFPLSGNCQSFTSLHSGLWEDNATVWSIHGDSGAACACSPGIGMIGKTLVSINNTITSSSLSSMSDSSEVFIGPNDTLIINRNTPLINFNLSKNAKILVFGTLIIHGNFNITDNTRVSTGNGGSITVYGNMSYSGNALIMGGDVNVYGNAIKSGHGFVMGKVYEINVATGVKTQIIQQ
jgi:hypothetical protein